MIETAIIDALAVGLKGLSLADYQLEGEPNVYKRSLDGTDPNFSIGITFVSWEPKAGANISGWEPAVAEYRFSIQTLIKHQKREDGEHLGAVVANRVRLLLYRNEALRLSLHQISESEEDLRERVIRSGVERQDAADASIKSAFAFMSMTDFCVETEIA